MSITITLKPEVEARVRAEAARQGRPAEEIVARQVEKAFPAPHPEAEAILNGRFRPLAEADAELRAKYGIPEWSHLSREELNARLEETLSKVPPEKIAEAERLGLL